MHLLRKSRLFRFLAVLIALLTALLSLGGCTQDEVIDTALSVLDAVLTDAGESSSGGQSAPPESANAPPQSETESQPPEPPSDSSSQAVEPEPDSPSVDEDGWYSDKDSVALYLHTYGRLPGNYLTKKEAASLGWDSRKGNLWEVAEGMSIGGDSFGNREGLLPNANGRKWYECDINYQGGFRGAERILYSNDGLIYYTGDHYQSYTQLY